MKKSRICASAMVAVLTIATVGSPLVSAAEKYFAAPDGKTVAADTPAAANGAYDAWKESWQNVSKDWTQVSLTPGENESQMNFAWYSKNGESVSFKYGKISDLSDSKTINPVQTETTQKDADGVQYTSNKVSLENLESGVTYYYQVDNKEIASFKTGDSSDFSFIFVGDPQIGSSNDKKAKKPENLNEEFYQAQYESVESDSFNWNNTLNEAMKKSGNKASFVLSAGDQIQTNAKKVEDYTVSEIEYAGYLSPSVLKSLPVATTVGNHDADNANYLYHFNLPNLSDLGSNGIVGGDYSFTYGDALFIMLNTQDTNTAEHKEFIEKAVEKCPDARWRIVTLHQDIYGSAEHSNEPEIVNLRYSLVPIFQENDIDVVLTGHDHAYSRSQLLKDGVKDISGYSDDEFDEQFEKDIDVGEENKDVQITTSCGNIEEDTQDEGEKAYLDYLNKIMDADAVVEVTKNQDTAVNPEGILYMTAGSSSGSKYYDLVARQQTYIDARWQEDVPTYSIIEMDETSFTINTYRTDNNEAIDKQLTIVKSVDKTELADEVKKLEEMNLLESDYTKESWNAYIAALNGARSVIADDTADTQTINNALAALKSAFAALAKNEQTPAEEKNNTENPQGQNDNQSDNKNNKENSQTQDSANDKAAIKTSNVKSPKTGDASSVILYCIMGVLDIGMLAVAYVQKKDDCVEQ